MARFLAELEALLGYGTCNRVGVYLLGLLFLAVVIVGCGRNERVDAIYAERCLNCHGPTGRGDGPLVTSLPVAVPDFRTTVERKSIPEIRRVIADGKGIMPAFRPALSQSEVSDMVQMVRFLSREGRDISWWERFDTLVVAHCSVPWELVLGYDEPAAGKTR
jgi:hypothetical protein